MGNSLGCLLGTYTLEVQRKIGFPLKKMCFLIVGNLKYPKLETITSIVFDFHGNITPNKGLINKALLRETNGFS